MPNTNDNPASGDPSGSTADFDAELSRAVDNILALDDASLTDLLEGSDHTFQRQTTPSGELLNTQDQRAATPN